MTRKHGPLRPFNPDDHHPQSKAAQGHCTRSREHTKNPDKWGTDTTATFQRTTGPNGKHEALCDEHAAALANTSEDLANALAEIAAIQRDQAEADGNGHADSKDPVTDHEIAKANADPDHQPTNHITNGDTKPKPKRKRTIDPGDPDAAPINDDGTYTRSLGKTFLDNILANLSDYTKQQDVVQNILATERRAGRGYTYQFTATRPEHLHDLIAIFHEAAANTDKPAHQRDFTENARMLTKTADALAHHNNDPAWRAPETTHA